MILTDLRRGLAAGLLAGLLAGAFAFFFGEPSVSSAIQLESEAAAHSHSHERSHEEVFSRGEQKSGLILATTLYGTAVGGIFGLASAFFRGRVSLHNERARSVVLAGTVFFGAVLLPFLKYPPNPPGVGADPSTLAERTFAYLAMMALGVLAVLAAWRFRRGLENAGGRLRNAGAAGVLVVLWGILYFAMPGFEVDAGGVPGALLWSFRLSSLGTQAVLWAGIGVIFGLLGERAARRANRRQTA